MALRSLDIPPGIYKEDSDHVSKNRWIDSNNIRFFKRFAEKIGGYSELSESGVDLLDPARGAHVWRTLDGTAYLAFGTRRKLWLYDDSDNLYDITPIRASGTLNDPFDTTSGSAIVTVTDAGHGAATGETVIFSNADPVGGITIDGSYILTFVDNNTYTITHSSAATSTANGGGSVDYEYEINIGLDEATELTETFAWGEGTWSEGPWGGGTPTLAGVIAFRIWTLANWGEDLVATYWGGPMYQWDASGGTSTRAVAISNSPSINNSLFVSADTRHIVSLGSYTGSAQDPLLIRWADQETLTTWTPAITNTAGDKLLDTGNDIVGSTSTRFGQLVLTDFSAHIMSYIGPPFIFSVKKVGERCGLLSPHAVSTYNDLAYWMSRGRFFMYDGVVREVFCDFQDEIFDGLNLSHSFKVTSGTNVEKHEIWWFFPETPSLENNRAVIYNVKDQVWYLSDFPRSSWLDKNVFTSRPVAVDNNGTIFGHETGVNANGNALPYYIQTGDMLMGEGDQFMHIRRIIPDFKRITGDHSVTLNVKQYPNKAASVKGPYAFGEDVGQISLRGRGRSISMRIESTDIDSDIRMGIWRADATPHGER